MQELFYGIQIFFEVRAQQTNNYKTKFGDSGGIRETEYQTIEQVKTSESPSGSDRKSYSCRKGNGLFANVKKYYERTLSNPILLHQKHYAKLLQCDNMQTMRITICANHIIFLFREQLIWYLNTMGTISPLVHSCVHANRIAD